MTNSFRKPTNKPHIYLSNGAWILALDRGPWLIFCGGWDVKWALVSMGFYFGRGASDDWRR